MKPDTPSNAYIVLGWAVAEICSYYVDGIPPGDIPLAELLARMENNIYGASQTQTAQERPRRVPGVQTSQGKWRRPPYNSRKTR